MKIQGVPEERYLNKESESHPDKKSKLQNPDHRVKDRAFVLFRLTQLLHMIPTNHDKV